MKKLIIFPASMKGVGLLYHFTDLAISLYESLKDSDSYDIKIVSEINEQNPGLWKRLMSVVPAESVIAINDQSELTGVVSEFLENYDYKQVIVLTQGLKQFTGLIKLKRKHRNRLWLYTRLNSFRHGSVVRPFLTYIYSFIFNRYADYVNFQCAYTADIFFRSNSILRSGRGGIIP